jgi:predicted peroxiredoxin
MAEKKKLVALITCGLDDERSSVAFSVINGGIKSDLQIMAFLTSSGVDWARKGAIEKAQLNPLDPPMKEMMQNLINSGGRIVVCPPCWNVRGYSESDLIEAAELKGSPAMHEWIKEGAATLCF